MIKTDCNSAQLLDSAREGKITYLDATNSALYQDDSLDSAIEIALEGCTVNPDTRIIQRLGELYVFSGQSFQARAIFSRLQVMGCNMKSTNLIYTGIDSVRAIVDDDVGLFYVPIPKCGSSTIKNYITLAKYGKEYSGRVHNHHREMYRTVPVTDIAHYYSDYTFVCVIRDPIERLESFFRRNISQGGLKRETKGLDSFMNLTTQPSAENIANNFLLYRQNFRTFRAHTDRYYDLICGNRKLLKSITLLDTASTTTRDTIGQLYGTEIPDKKSQVSVRSSEDNQSFRDTLATREITSWYADDIKIYSRKKKLSTDSTEIPNPV